jgi:hypothetical protein
MATGVEVQSVLERTTKIYRKPELNVATSSLWLVKKSQSKSFGGAGVMLLRNAE